MSKHYDCPICGYEGLPEPPVDTYGFQTYVRCDSCGFTWDDRVLTEDLDDYIYPRLREEWRETQRIRRKAEPA
jgi:uncharacterized Zn finger protein